MNFIFCDDDVTFLNTITDLMKNELDQHQIEVQMITCTSGKGLFEIMEHTEPDAIFLDIDMPEMTGFHIAEQIEKRSDSPIIIFVSSKDHLVFESFSYHPFWFLRKSDLSQVSVLVEKLIAYVRSTRHLFHFKIQRQHISIPLKDIRYFEHDNHYITVHTTSASYQYKASIGEIFEELSAFYFVRPHVGFLVNCRYIAMLQKNGLRLMSGEVIPVARGRMKEMQKQFIAYTRSIHL